MEQPKRPSTPYVFFMNEKRGDIKKKHPDLDFSECSKMIAQQWKSLPENEKQKYMEMADKDKGRYRQEKEEFEKVQLDKERHRKEEFDNYQDDFLGFGVFFSQKCSQLKQIFPHMKGPPILELILQEWSYLGLEGINTYIELEKKIMKEEKMPAVVD